MPKIIECKPLGSFWYADRHRNYYAIKVQGGRWKGSPWLLCYTSAEDDFFHVDCDGFRTYRSASKEHKEARLERCLSGGGFYDATPYRFAPQDSYHFISK